MKASVLINILSRSITQYGDKPVIVRADKDNTCYELMLGFHGDFWGKQRKGNSKESVYIFLDMDLI